MSKYVNISKVEALKAWVIHFLVESVVAVVGSWIPSELSSEEEDLRYVVNTISEPTRSFCIPLRSDPCHLTVLSVLNVSSSRCLGKELVSVDSTLMHDEALLTVSFPRTSHSSRLKNFVNRQSLGLKQM